MEPCSIFCCVVWIQFHVAQAILEFFVWLRTTFTIMSVTDILFLLGSVGMEVQDPRNFLALIVPPTLPLQMG